MVSQKAMSSLSFHSKAQLMLHTCYIATLCRQMFLHSPALCMYQYSQLESCVIDLL